MKLLICYGTRPEYIKIKPLIEELKGNINFSTLYITQHEDIVNDKKFDYILKIKTENINRLNNIFSEIFLKFESIAKDFTHILVQGDTATVCAIALASFNLKKKIIHLEAGLRTYDKENPYPEESYRQIVSRISDINLCPTESNQNNLIKEFSEGKKFLVGNTALDNLNNVKTTYGNKILVTLHRRENHQIIPEYFKEISKLAKENPNFEFILPIHPNPNIIKYKHILEGVNVKNPLSHDELINILKDCLFCITDSGGIQEEASFLKKRCIVCRKTTERQEGIGSFFVMCPEPKFLKNCFKNMRENYIINNSSPFGDGLASKKIVKILKDNE